MAGEKLNAWPTLAVDMTGATTGGAPVNITFDIDGSAPLVLLPPNDPSDACFSASPAITNFDMTIGAMAYSFSGPASLFTYPSDCSSTQAGLLKMSGDGHFWGVGMDARTLVDFTVAGALEGWEQTGSGRLDDNTLFSISPFKMTSIPEPALLGLFVTGLLALAIWRRISKTPGFFEQRKSRSSLLLVRPAELPAREAASAT